MERFMKLTMTVLIAALVIATGLTFWGSSLTKGEYSAQYDATSKLSQIMITTVPSTFTTTDDKPLTVLHAGQTVIMHETILRRHSDCFATYTISFRMDGREYLQFPPRYTTVLVEKGETILHIPAPLDLPRDMAEGEYDVSATVFPTCNSFSMPPYNMGAHTRITVVK